MSSESCQSAGVIIKIRYCSLCRWMLRASWLAQELLTTFEGEIFQLVLEPGAKGEFQIWVVDELVWDRKRDDGFPDAKELKRRVRDCIDPERNLGHIDR